MAFGFQEVESFTTTMLITSTVKEEAWINAINNGLGEDFSSSYFKVLVKSTIASLKPR
jgi:hypothetical protein